MKAYAGAIDQQLSEDMTSAEISTDMLSNDSITPSKRSKRVQLALDRNARLVVMMLEVLAFPLDTNDVVNSLEIER